MQVESRKKSRKEMKWQRRLAQFAASEACQGILRGRVGVGGEASPLVPAVARNGRCRGFGDQFIDVGVLPLAAQSASATHGELTDTALEIRLDLEHGLVLHIVKR